MLKVIVVALAISAAHFVNCDSEEDDCPDKFQLISTRCVHICTEKKR